MSVNVVAPMPGTITEILVQVGDQVKADEELIILEAMKMENPICAPSGGKVAEIKVSGAESRYQPGIDRPRVGILTSHTFIKRTGGKNEF